MYDEYLKLQPYQTDWSVRKNKENNHFKHSNKRRNPTDETKGTSQFSGNKNYKPSIKVSPMTI